MWSGFGCTLSVVFMNMVGIIHLRWPIIPAQDCFDVLEEKDQYSLSAWLDHGSQEGGSDPSGSSLSLSLSLSHCVCVGGGEPVCLPSRSP
jgi:hypothetical protein